MAPLAKYWGGPGPPAPQDRRPWISGSNRRIYVTFNHLLHSTRYNSLQLLLVNAAVQRSLKQRLRPSSELITDS